MHKDGNLLHNGEILHSSVSMSQNRTFRCSRCNEVFHRKSEFKRHRHEKHNKQNVYTCYQCYEAFHHKRDLIYHWKHQCNQSRDEAQSQDDKTMVTQSEDNRTVAQLIEERQELTQKKQQQVRELQQQHEKHRRGPTKQASA